MAKLLLFAIPLVVCTALTGDWLTLFDDSVPKPTQTPLVTSCFGKVMNVYNLCANLTFLMWNITLDSVDNVPVPFSKEFCCSTYMVTKCARPFIKVILHASMLYLLFVSIISETLHQWRDWCDLQMDWLRDVRCFEPNDDVSEVPLQRLLPHLYWWILLILSIN